MYLEKLAAKAKKKKKKGGHIRPGTAAMVGALLGPLGAGAGAEIGRRGRATEGSPAIRSYLGSILGGAGGALGGAALGALGVGGAAKLRKLVASKKVRRKLGRDYVPAALSIGGGLGLLGGGIGGYFEGARRGAESVKYK